eukprot:s160_g2.t1
MLPARLACILPLLWIEPHLDQLIREGVLLERHYAYKICSPSRSSIQTGRLPVHVNSVNTGVTFWNPEDARKCIGVTCM